MSAIVIDRRFGAVTVIPTPAQYPNFSARTIVIDARGAPHIYETIEPRSGLFMSWYCSACGSYNAQDDSRRCRMCGTPRTP